MKLSRLGEFGLIDRIRRKVAVGRGVRLGIGDDAAWIDQPQGSSLVTADLLIEGIHFDLKWTSLADLGYKSLAVNISDIAAMGGEAEPGGWGQWITGPEPEKSLMFAFGTGFYTNMVFGDPAWDYRKFNVDADLRTAVAKTAGTLNATDPDLRRFKARGGKLILYHGWCDPAIPARGAPAPWSARSPGSRD